MPDKSDTPSAKTVHRAGGGPRLWARGVLGVILPGVLVAATGVGAGDLNAAGLAGRDLGLVVLWACLLGAMLKFVVTEGLARWQLATGETLLEGAMRKLGLWVSVPFGVYFVLWSVIVTGALASACGKTVAAMALDSGLIAEPLGSDRVFWIGIAHGAAGAALVALGGFKTFERVMAALVGVMFLTVLVSVVLIGPDWPGVLRGVALPTVPPTPEGGALDPVARTVALIGGVGGTLTVLAYGYWIREHKRTGMGDLGTCRVDLGVGYLCTALFGMGVLVVGATGADAVGGGNLMSQLGSVLAERVGEPARWVFLVGAWCAVFSSVLGVWQCVPAIWCDYADEIRRPAPEVRGGPLHRRPLYLGYAAFLTAAPIILGRVEFDWIQITYGVVGAFFLPMLALCLLIMNGRRSWVGDARNGVWAVIALTATLLFFGWIGAQTVWGIVRGLIGA